MRRWDIFCKVIDNFGDIGVCWRLASDLVTRGEVVRLWLDEVSALAWMAPSASRPAGLSVHPWPPGELAAQATWPEPGDVVIEAFGCELPERFVARMQRPSPPVWINLEYLSAESYVERSHGLRSPVFSGPGAGLQKWFFYPGFTPRTGGLLREPGTTAARDALQADTGARQKFLHDLGVQDDDDGGCLVTVFCYPDAPLHALLDDLSTRAIRVRMLLAHGAATELGQTWLDRQPGHDHRVPGPKLHFLPTLSQTDFDRLLWCADLNLVRGEDSAVRALWAARPHVWQIYKQDDGVHAGKLEAFAALWMADWPPELREQTRRAWAAWNQLPGSREQDLALLSEWLASPSPEEAGWAVWSALSSARLAKQTDLSTQLLHFVIEPG